MKRSRKWLMSKAEVALKGEEDEKEEKVADE
jgi:hypothetical protein